MRWGSAPSSASTSRATTPRPSPRGASSTLISSSRSLLFLPATSSPPSSKSSTPPPARALPRRARPDRDAHRAVAHAHARLHGAGGDGVAAHHAAGVGHRGAAALSERSREHPPLRQPLASAAAGCSRGRRMLPPGQGGLPQPLHRQRFRVKQHMAAGPATALASAPVGGCIGRKQQLRPRGTTGAPPRDGCRRPLCGPGHAEGSGCRSERQSG